MASFQLSGIPHEPYASLFELSDQELVQYHAKRVIADSDSGFPCRISLRDAGIGDELLLLPFVHMDVESPYRSSGPIFVRRGQTRCVLQPDEVPPYVSRRLMSLRAYDTQQRMLSGSVVEGDRVSSALDTLFENPAVSYVHLHNAGHGCFSCVARRA